MHTTGAHAMLMLESHTCIGHRIVVLVGPSHVPCSVCLRCSVFGCAPMPCLAGVSFRSQLGYPPLLKRVTAAMRIGAWALSQGSAGSACRAGVSCIDGGSPDSRLHGLLCSLAGPRGLAGVMQQGVGPCAHIVAGIAITVVAVALHCRSGGSESVVLTLICSIDPKAAYLVMPMFTPCASGSAGGLSRLLTEPSLFSGVGAGALFPCPSYAATVVMLSVLIRTIGWAPIQLFSPARM